MDERVAPQVAIYAIKRRYMWFHDAEHVILTPDYS
jgi:hypothetical protein